LCRVKSALDLGLEGQWHAKEHERCSGLFTYDHARIQEYTATRVWHPREIVDIRRNLAGTLLYCIGSKRSSSGTWTFELLSIGNHSSQSRELPGRITFLDNGARVVAWSDDLKKGVEFEDGTRRTLAKFGHFDVDPGGRFFVLQAQSGRTEVGRTESPNRAIYETNVAMEWIYAGVNRLYLFARASDALYCEILRVNGGGATLERTLRLKRPGEAPSPFVPEDLDASTERLLVRDVRDYSADKWYVFSLASGDRTDLGDARGVGLFMHASPL